MAEQVDPQMQQNFDRWIAKGFKLIHSPESRTAIIEMVTQAPNPVEGVANAVVLVETKLDEVSRQSNVEVHDAIKFQSAQVFLGDIVKIAKVQLNPKQIKAALALAINKYVRQEIDAGRMDPNELQNQVSQLHGQMSPEEREGAEQDFKDIDEVGNELNQNKQVQPQQSMLGS